MPTAWPRSSSSVPPKSRNWAGQIVGWARHTQLIEPETAIRQISAFLDKTEGISQDGKSSIERVFVPTPKCRGFPSDA